MFTGRLPALFSRPYTRAAKRRSFVSCILGCVIPAALACTPTGGVTEALPVTLGAIYNLTGTQASLDVPAANGTRLAVAAINRDGGLLGRPVQLVLEDGESTPAVIKRKTAALLKMYPDTAALVGLSDTDMVLAAAPVAAKSHTLFLTPGATSPRLTTQVPKYLFLASFGDNVQAGAAAEWAYRALSARTVAVLFNESMEYTRLLHGYFERRFSQLGGKILAIQGYASKGLPTVVQRMPKADLVFAAAGPEDALKVVLSLRQAGYRGPILGGDGFDSDVWLAHPEVRNLFFTTHVYLGADNLDPRVIAFRKAYMRAFPGSIPDAFAALGYDAVQLLALAIVRAKSAAPGDVIESFAGIKGFEGVTGIIGFAAGSGIPNKSVSILRIEKGRRSLARKMVPMRVPAP